MDNTLHVFSSVESYNIFNTSSIQGEAIIFDEKLTEGEIKESLFSDDFWMKRYAFFEENYQLSKLDYFDNVIKTINVLENSSDFKEVVFWGDFSLKSQVALVALFAHLNKYYEKQVSYFLVCSGKHKGRTSFQKLTDYTSEEFAILYQYKTKITQPNLEFTAEAWKVFASKDKSEIQQFNWNTFSSKFQYLHLTMNQYANEYL